MGTLSHLEPENVFRFFKELAAIPHGSGNMGPIGEYLLSFAKERGLTANKDEAGNVVIFKPATKGYETYAPIILQGHLDMVCEKVEDSSHDFLKDPLDLYVEEGYLRARGTTLGGDDGIAIAMALAVLDASDLVHPAIEAVFTVDEETTMGGAMALDMSQLHGRYLINIDSEEEGVLTVGCAGGINQEICFLVDREQREGTLLTVCISGLKGGHSGSEIHQQRGNANKMMGELLNHIMRVCPFNLIAIDGGQKENVITNRCVAQILVEEKSANMVTVEVQELWNRWKKEWGSDEPNLLVELQKKEKVVEEAMSVKTSQNIITFLVCAPQGVLCFNRELEGQVETSLNLGVVSTKKEEVHILFLIRSAMETKKRTVTEQIDALATICGGKSTLDNEYPAWEYYKDSRLRPLMENVFKEYFGKEPRVETIHAGLECGMFAGKCSNLDCVSFGPNIKEVHSVHEKLDIASTKRMWEYLIRVLENCRFK